MQEAEKEVDHVVRHVEQGVHLVPKQIVATQEGGFGGQVFLYGPLDTAVEEFGMRRGVEKPVEVSRVVQHADIEALSWLPLYQRQQALRIVLQRIPVLIDPFQDGGGDGENDTRRIEAALRKNVMDQVAVNTAVAVLEWVDVDETECEDCGGNHGIERLRGTPVEGDMPPISEGRSSGRALI